MDGRALAAAFDMEGGFNDVALTLLPGASEAEVIAPARSPARALRRARRDPARACRCRTSISTTSCAQLQSVGLIVPSIFLGVAAFLLNVVLTRIVAVQREQIAALKAFGYTNGELGWHYLKLSLLIGVAGGALGIGVGAWLGAA